MIVLDASAAIDLLTGLGAHERIAERVRQSGEKIHAPHLLDAEVAHGLRRLWIRGVISSSRAREAIADLVELRVIRYPHRHLLTRAWELRANLTVFDALYVSLAEALEAPLVTADARVGRAPGHEARVEVYSA